MALPLHPSFQKVLADVEQFGWHVVMVPADAEGPGFAYTIGLTATYGHPELLIFGLPLPTMHAILNVAGELVRAGQKFQAGTRSDAILEGAEVLFGTIRDLYQDEYLGQAQRFSGQRRVAALQLIWPNRAGQFPGLETPVDPDIQPLLDR
ncbi:DUF4262 domain-containing protein [Deinococcus sp. HMF7604]|uniref:DUF4262 domain-containing protein n=1 Tax=Deinococcus betulae TaxID=2873312 RepID=UPI001CC9C9AF|nr:DUF4262 domain-containing protein [Deinococcus betulae]MBZ9752066.1 DUF4262 domain-containing protein [Deinococcus betulae]